MDIKQLRIGLLIGVTQLFLAITCNKNGSKPCTLLTPYSFSVTSEFIPEKQIYRVGDTIFFHSVFPKNMINSITNQLVDYSNSIGVGGTISFGYMDTVTKSGIDSYSSFELVQEIGSFKPIVNTPEKGVATQYNEAANYEFKVGIIVKKKGLFVISINNLGSQGLRGKDCTNAGFNMTVTNTNKNLQLFEYALGYPADAMLAKNIFCFRVQ